MARVPVVMKESLDVYTVLDRNKTPRLLPRVCVEGAPLRLPKPLSDQFAVRVCSCPLCIINRLCRCRGCCSLSVCVCLCDLLIFSQEGRSRLFSHRREALVMARMPVGMKESL